MQDKAAFLDYVNKNNFLDHYSSPVKNEPNDSIAAKFWTDKNYQTLPYKRGFIYAFYLDNQIRLASRDKKTIRDFLLALYTRNRQIHSSNPNAHLTMDDYIAVASRFIPEKKVRYEIENYLMKGNLLDFRKIKLIDGFTIDYKDSIPVLKISKTTNLKKIYAW
jgi:predicted metalloprotease with PDZ domain